VGVRVWVLTSCCVAIIKAVEVVALVVDAPVVPAVRWGVVWNEDQAVASRVPADKRMFSHFCIAAARDCPESLSVKSAAEGRASSMHPVSLPSA
jgi:hypothetical protein